jgi:hypothetical protein
MKRDSRTANEVEAALGMPSWWEWTDVEVSFATDEMATATVTLLISKQQLLDLVAAGVDIGPGTERPDPPDPGRAVKQT